MLTHGFGPIKTWAKEGKIADFMLSIIHNIYAEV
jgi:hypothetical protein